MELSAVFGNEVKIWIMNPLSERILQRLQHNINSSKAISSLSHADRATIATGGMSG
uniref:Uncharacterized protein n=1 Tax=Parascaris equorum TaxID=6256 RepID=A0A914RDU7_PAREQ